MIYECIEEFCVDIVDGDGFTEKQDGFYVEKGSMWEVDNEEVNVTGAEVHLEELDGMNFLEISKNRLGTNFREV